MENLIEELTKVNPANLSEEGLKLFNKIMEIIDRNNELEEKSKKAAEISSTIMADFINKDVIPKSKVEEKLEKLNKQEKQELKGIKGQDRYFIKQIYQAKRSSIEELLQEGGK